MDNPNEEWEKVEQFIEKYWVCCTPLEDIDQLEEKKVIKHRDFSRTNRDTNDV